MYQILLLIAALALTIVVECGLSLAFRSRQLSLAVLLGNLLTNPLLNLILLLYAVFVGEVHYYTLMAVLEMAAVLAETWVIRSLTDYPPLKAGLLSLFFNATSFGVGLLFW